MYNLLLTHKKIAPTERQSLSALFALVKARLRESIATSNYTLSDYGREFIKSREGLSLRIYKDSANLLTIGWGHLIKRGENFKAGITLGQAETLFTNDLTPFIAAVNGTVQVVLTQNQFDALVSLAFNIGIFNFKRSTLVQLLNKRQYQSTADQFLVWSKTTINGKLIEVEGLKIRRRLERGLFLR